MMSRCLVMKKHERSDTRNAPATASTFFNGLRLSYHVKTLLLNNITSVHRCGLFILYECSVLKMLLPHGQPLSPHCVSCTFIGCCSSHNFANFANSFYISSRNQGYISKPLALHLDPSGPLKSGLKLCTVN